MRLQHGGARGWAIPVGAARAPPPPPSLAAPGLARSGGRHWSERRGMGERDGWERAAWDGHAAAARRSERAASRREGRAREGRCVGEGQRRAHACGSGETKCRYVFYFLENRVVLKVERRRPVWPDCWANP
jgi:hypothetical protein